MKICTQRFYYSSSKFSKFIQGTVSLLFFSSWPLSLLKEKPKICPKLIELLFFSEHFKSDSDTCLQPRHKVERKQPSRVGGSPLCDVVSSFLLWSAHFFVTHIQTEKISSWNGPTVHVCCFILARASTKTFVSRVRKTAKKIFVSRKIR